MLFLALVHAWNACNLFFHFYKLDTVLICRAPCKEFEIYMQKGNILVIEWHSYIIGFGQCDLWDMYTGVWCPTKYYGSLVDAIQVKTLFGALLYDHILAIHHEKNDQYYKALPCLKGHKVFLQGCLWVCGHLQETISSLDEVCPV